MSSFNDDDVCRVCRAEGTEQDPLFYPCKCSGSIRYVHQDCLMEWLSHSQKKHCELCKTPFQFTNLYDPAMPKRLPLLQMLQKMVLDVERGILLVLRWFLVSVVWLGWLPYCTRHIWRGAMRIGDLLTSNGFTNLNELVGQNISSSMNATITPNELSGNSTVHSLETFLPYSLERLTRFDTFNKLMTEVFEGQVITSVIIAIFVVIFLIREWIVQNNGNLLNEAQEFLGRGQPNPVDQLWHHQLRLAGPRPNVAARHLEAPHQAPVDRIRDQPGALLRGELDESDPLEPRTLTQRQNPAENSGWDTLTAQAIQNSRRAREASSSGSSDIDSTRNSTGDTFLNPDSAANDLDVPDGGSHITDESVRTAAELRALRRQAVLRATSQRINHASTRAELAQLIDVVHLEAASEDTTSRLNAVEQLDAQLATGEGLPDVESARTELARKRSFERRAWEQTADVGGEQYPDSPMPALSSTPIIEDDLALPLSILTPDSVDAASRAASSLGNSTLRREVEIAATSQNPSANYEELGTEHERQIPLPLSSTQLDQLLAQIRAAATPTERTHVANAAIQVCIDVAQLLHPEVPLSRASPLYRETIRQVGLIATVANECGIDNALDVERAFRIAVERPLLRNAQTLEDVALINEQQEDVGDLRAAAQEAAVEHNAVREDIDDDIDGLLQLIGVRGPIVTLLQNSMLVVIMMTAFIVFGVCLPSVCGRCMIAVAKDPRTCLIAIPTRAIVACLRELGQISQLILRSSQHLLRPIAKRSASVNQILVTLQQIVGYTTKFQAKSGLSDPSGYFRSLKVNAQYVVRSSIGLSKICVRRLGIIDAITKSGATIPDKLQTVVSGYVGLTTIGALYLRANRRLTSGEQGKQIELALRSFLRQTGFVMKFIAILGIELIMFPFYCGLLLDAVFLPLFSNISLLDRIVFLVQYPFTGIFLHWLVGTVYMFNFALFVSMCRELVRPGVLYFVRDPNDPGFNPIKDILERPIRSQMKKIGVSVMIYGTLIVGAFGSVVWGVAFYMRGVLPINWSTPRPVFEVPLDLLLFQILLPITYQYVKPHKKIKAVWMQWFISTSRLLRLSSFMLGERDANQEGHVEGRTSLLSQLWYRAPKADDATFIRNGSFRRVPTTDSLPMRKGKDMIMAVTEDNVLVDEREEDETKDDPNYTVVYAPPNFKLRIYIFMFLMWAFAAMFCVSCTMLPLVFGRKIFRFLSPDGPMHDLFAFFYGAYALGGAIWGLTLIFDMGDSLMKLGTLHDRQSSSALLKKRLCDAALFSMKWLYLISTLSIITPTLLGLCIETYVIIPLGIWLNPMYTPTIHLAHDWILGLIYVKIIGRTALLLPMSSLGQALNNTMRNDWGRGWRNPDLHVATKKIILPVAGALISALMLPLSIGALARGTVYRSAPKEIATLIYRMSYPAALISALVIVAAKGAQVLINRWRSEIRDSLYLKGRQLHNFGETEPPVSSHNASEPLVNAEDEEIIEEILQELLYEIDNGEITIMSPTTTSGSINGSPFRSPSRHEHGQSHA